MMFDKSPEPGAAERCPILGKGRIFSADPIRHYGFIDRGGPPIEIKKEASCSTVFIEYEKRSGRRRVGRVSGCGWPMR